MKRPPTACWWFVVPFAAGAVVACGGPIESVESTFGDEVVTAYHTRQATASSPWSSQVWPDVAEPPEAVGSGETAAHDLVHGISSRNVAESVEAVLPLSQPMEREEFLRRVWSHHPTLQARRRDVEAVRARFTSADRLSEVTRSVRSFTQQLDLRVAPPPGAEPVASIFPWPGMTALRGEWLRWDERVAVERLRGAAVDVFAQSIDAWAEWVFHRRHREVIESQLELIDQLEPVIEHQLRGGGGTLADLIALRAESAALTARSEAVADRLVADRQQLARLLADEVDNLPDPPIAGVVPRPIAAWGVEQWLAWALAERPMVREAKAVEARAALTLRIAERSTLPSESPGLRPRVSPWMGTAEAALTELRAREEAATARVQDITDQTRLDLERALAFTRTASRDHEVARTQLVPLAEEAYEVARSAYDGGRTRFPDVLEALHRLWEARLTQAEAERGRLLAEAARLRAVGAQPVVPLEHDRSDRAREDDDS